jgi:uncharacterized protein (DUF2147 family)
MRSMIFLPLIAVATAAQAAEPITGRWITDDGKAVVTIGQCGKVVCGRITKVLAPTPNGPPVDERNSDPTLRKRPIQGLEVLSGFIDQGEDWRGRIYDPEAGRWYKSLRRKAASCSSAARNTGNRRGDRSGGAKPGWHISPAREGIARSHLGECV